MLVNEETAIRDVEALASLIGDRNFISFQEIESQLGLSDSRVFLIKPDLEDFLTRSNDGVRITVTSLMRSNPPGLFIED